MALVGAVGQGALQSPTAVIPETLEFEIVKGDYSIFVQDEGAQGGPTVNAVASVICDIDNNGASIQVLGSSQGIVSSEGPLGELVGDFSAQAGPTTVACYFPDNPQTSGYEYVVTPVVGMSVGTIVFIVLGVLALVGSGLNWLFWVLRRPR